VGVCGVHKITAKERFRIVDGLSDEKKKVLRCTEFVWKEMGAPLHMGVLCRLVDNKPSIVAEVLKGLADDGLLPKGIVVPQYRKRKKPDSFVKPPIFKVALSDRQEDVLNFIRMHQVEKGYCPSLAEISEFLGCKNRMTAHQHVMALRQKGWLTWEKGRNRALVLL